MKKFKKPMLLVLLLVMIVLLFTYGFTFAKYVSSSILNYYFKSKGFYFSSDNLDLSTIRNVNTQWNGEDIYFNVKNNLNQTVVTNYDIDYSVVCTIEGEASAYTKCNLNDTESSVINGILSSSQVCKNNTEDGVNVSLFNKTECELGGYNWIDQIATRNIYFNVALTDSEHELNDVTVNITATSTSPYRKVLKGDFVLQKKKNEENKFTMEYKNYSNYDRLVISNSYTSAKCVKVTWDSNKLVINANNSEFSSYSMDSNNYINEIKFNIGAKKSLNYIFYKRDFGANYGVNEFTIEDDTGC